MNALIVYAHPNPNSLNASLRDEAVEAFKAIGANVEVSDLYAMNFNPVAQLYEVSVSPDSSAVPEDLQVERRKVSNADVILFQFPMWWTSMPAILKGWFDRVFAYGFAYGPGVYNHGNFKGKKAILSITTGGRHLGSYGPNGIKGELSERLFNIHHEILYFSGFDVLEPFVFPSGLCEEERKEYIDSWKCILKEIEKRPAISFSPIEDYENGQLKIRN